MPVKAAQQPELRAVSVKTTCSESTILLLPVPDVDTTSTVTVSADVTDVSMSQSRTVMCRSRPGDTAVSMVRLPSHTSFGTTDTSCGGWRSKYVILSSASLPTYMILISHSFPLRGSGAGAVTGVGLLDTVVLSVLVAWG